MNGIGESPPRPDGFAKVSGAARYVDDLVLPGMWHGATLRSPHPHARLRSIRFDPAAAPAGTVCVTAADLPGPNGVQLLDDGWPILADGVVLHVGEPVALVAAPTRLAARQALAAVTAEYEPLTPVFTLEGEGSLPPLYELGLESGDVDAAFAGADRVIEGEHRTGHQEHIYIECQGMIAEIDGDGIRVTGSMQCPYYVHRALAYGLGIPEDKVRVRASVVGGGFGGKEDFPSALALHAALLARACGRPVKMVYDRHEDIVATSKRHPALIRHRTAVDRDGRLLALDGEILLDGGAYRTLSSVVLSRALLHAFGPYRWPSVRLRGKVLRTHTPPNSAFRGFGAPQVEFAIERQMDLIARSLGVDPYEIRARNVVEPGDRLPTGQVLDKTTSARLCLEEAERLTGFRAKWKAQEEARKQDTVDGEPRRGIGLALFFHGAGFTGNGERKMKSPVTARLLEDGRIEVLTAMTDMGQGCVAVFPQIAAAAAGIGPEDLVFAEPDTGEVPDSGPTVASRTTMIVGSLIARTVSELRDRVLAQAKPGESFRDAARRYRREAGPVEVTFHHEPPEDQSFDESTYRGAAYPTYAWGADVVEVEVDPDTLAVKPLQVTAVCEVGRAIHPTLCAGQIEGGTLQALGWALLEEVKLQDGRYLNDRLATYIIPTIKDSPRIDVHLLEQAWEGGPFGAKGVGELPMDGGAPAAAQAIENATGLAVNEIPATPERLMRAEDIQR